ncbi:1,5-anhydro-D-fructose reductase-like [Limulus polyphemus]|uniref:1,5-anhydro-D-fructose reductase-like n=1 Tax=Limulus polyphemus TaxID=6850 RepID=A0ABM1B2W7_LIMPO|nr:1,5-anhydro-D-fructose reductase-like [Limulus polyphemus]
MASFPHYVKLNNGARMPIIGLGTWQAKEGEVKVAVESAIDCGYRHIDTAWAYKNEKEIGKTLKKVFDAGKLKREDIFIVSKLPNGGHHRDKVLHYLQQSLDDLQLSYVDMYLVHSPFSVVPLDGNEQLPIKDGKLVIDYEADFLDTWKGMEDAVDAEMTKAIGISNFNSEQIKRIYDNARIKPANLQVECHAYFPQIKLFQICKELNISLTAYGPLGNPSLSGFLRENFGINAELPNLLKDPALQDIAEKHQKTAAQILLRWLIQRGIIVIPKSSNPNRIKQNFEVFDFNLSEEDVNQINGLDRNHRLFEYSGVEEHPNNPFNIPF